MTETTLGKIEGFASPKQIEISPKTKNNNYRDFVMGSVFKSVKNMITYNHKIYYHAIKIKSNP